jgi:hypothetical protein
MTVSTVAHAQGGGPQLTGPWIAAAPVQGARVGSIAQPGRRRSMMVIHLSASSVGQNLKSRLRVRKLSG